MEIRKPNRKNKQTALFLYSNLSLAFPFCNLSLRNKGYIPVGSLKGNMFYDNVAVQLPLLCQQVYFFPLATP